MHDLHHPKDPIGVAGRLRKKQPPKDQGFQYEQHECEDYPYQDHGMESPEAWQCEERPGIEPVQQVEAS